MFGLKKKMWVEEKLFGWGKKLVRKKNLGRKNILVEDKIVGSKRKKNASNKIFFFFEFRH